METVWVKNLATGMMWEVTEARAADIMKTQNGEYEFVEAVSSSALDDGGSGNAGLGGNGDDLPPVTPDMVDGMKHPELQKLAGELALAKSGTKDELTDRIKAKLAELAQAQ